MAVNYIDFQGDPSNSDAIASGDYVHIKTISAGGTYPDLVCPASPNFPAGTPAKYKVNLPGIPFVDGSHAMVIKDHTSGDVVLTLNASFPPGTGKYWLAPSGSKTPDVIFFDSGQAGHVISIDYYSSGSIFHAQDVNNININGSIVAYNGINIIPKQYIGGNIYNSVLLNISNLGSILWSTFIPYQTSDGNWRVKINFQIYNLNGIGSFLGSIAGLSFRSGLIFQSLPCSIIPTSSLNYTNAGSPSAFATLGAQQGGNNVEFFCNLPSVSGGFSVIVCADVELDSKPTWAD